jgi:hypothetical protein
MGDAVWARLLESHHAAVRRELERFNGEEIDTAGDGFLALQLGQVVRLDRAEVEHLFFQIGGSHSQIRRASPPALVLRKPRKSGDFRYALGLGVERSAKLAARPVHGEVISHTDVVEREHVIDDVRRNTVDRSPVEPVRGDSSELGDRPVRGLRFEDRFRLAATGWRRASRTATGWATHLDQAHVAGSLATARSNEVVPTRVDEREASLGRRETRKRQARRKRRRPLSQYADPGSECRGFLRFAPMKHGDRNDDADPNRQRDQKRNNARPKTH